MRIYLIGFMGAGKSFLGRQLADRLDFRFVDADSWLEKKYQKTISVIFKEEGEEQFRLMESEALSRSFSKMKNVVIATGGGMPCYHHGINKMKRNGVVVFLDPDVETIIERLANDDTRPLLKDRTDLEKFIKEKLAQRRAVYEQAGLVYSGSSVEELLSKLLPLL